MRAHTYTHTHTHTHMHARQMHLCSLLPSPFKEGPRLGLIARLQACTWASTYEERMPCSLDNGAEEGWLAARLGLAGSWQSP